MISDLRSYLKYLATQGRLKTIGESVSPELEITAFTDKANRENLYNSKALLFTDVEGSRMPVVTNLFGSMDTMRELFAYTYANELLGNLNGLKNQTNGISLLKGSKMLLDSKPKLTAPDMSKYERLGGLDELPALKTWPKDGGKYLTQPLVITESPKDGSVNVGIYRMQIYDKLTTGMHWQAQKGGTMHLQDAAEMKKDLKVSVAIGSDPYNVISAVAPLPHGINEFAFAGIARGAKTVLMKNGKYPAVPANAEIIINGHVDPSERRMEGPFGDHTGYYSILEDNPVFHVDSIYARKDNPIYAASIVGHPWHEDAVIGQFLFDFLKPVLKSMNDSIVDVYLPPEGIFTNMCLVSIKKRFPGEAKKVMFSLLGMGQMSFTKIIVVFDDDINIRDLSQVVWALSTRIDPQRDVQIISGATADSLDHTTNQTAHGSKMLIDATKKTAEEGYTRKWPDVISLPEELKKEVDRKWNGRS